MTLVQKEVKRITIRPNGTEKQIRPPAKQTFSLSTDLRNYTTEAQLQALWWWGIQPYNSASYTLNSNGLSLTNGWNKLLSLRCAMPFQLTTSHIITLETTWNGTAQRWSQRCNITSSEWDNDANNIGWYLSLHSSDNGTWIRVNWAWKWWQLGQWYGDYTQKVIINLSTWVIIYTWTTSYWIGTINKTYTMTSSEISSALSKTYIAFEQVKISWSSTQRIYTASIKIE